MTGHDRYEDLISASLTGDLNGVERAELDAHLAGCDDCRATLSAFTDARRMLSGLHHLPPPRDLHARVRTGIERGAFADLPWWRRPSVLFAGLAGSGALVAGVLLALVVINFTANDGQIGGSPSGAPDASASALASPSGSVDPGASVEPSPTSSPAPTPTPVAVAVDPAGYVALTGPVDNQAITVREGASDEPVTELPTTPGPPIAAALAPDGEWLAFITEVGESGMVETWLVRPADGSGPGSLGRSMQGSAFMEQLSWSPDGRHLAYAAINGEGMSDVWTVDTEAADPQARQLTGEGIAAVGSFAPDGALWVSLVADEATSYRLPGDALDDGSGIGDLPGTADATLEGWFQPLVSPDGARAVAWRGRLGGTEPLFSFISAGEPAILDVAANGRIDLDSAVSLFADVTVGRDGFASAGIAWGGDSNAIAVWDARWTGTPQSGVGSAPYPDPLRVYLGRADEEQPIIAIRALDIDDIPAEVARVVDVKVAADGRTLAIVAAHPRSGVLDAPRAELIIVLRHTGTTPDEVRPVPSDATAGWFGPAWFDDSP